MIVSAIGIVTVYQIAAIDSGAAARSPARRSSSRRSARLPKRLVMLLVVLVVLVMVFSFPPGSGW
jgi:hypothetical protein